MLRTTSGATSTLAKIGMGVIIPLIILALWQWVLLDVYDVLPAPAEVGRVMARYYRQAEFLNSLKATLVRVAIGYSVGVAAGVSLGITMGLSRLVSDLFDPLIGVLRPIAPIAWVPLAIIWFGLSEKAAVFIIAYAVMFPLLINTIAAVHGVNRIYAQAAQTLGVSRLTIIREVIIPGALPDILTGLRIGMGLSWAVIVAAELTIGYTLQTGLGYIMVRYSQVIFNVPRILAAIIAVGLLGLLTDRSLRWLENRLAPWRAGLTLR